MDTQCLELLKFTFPKNWVEHVSFSFIDIPGRGPSTILKYRDGGFDDRIAIYRGQFEGEPEMLPENIIDAFVNDNGFAVVMRDGIWTVSYNYPKTEDAGYLLHEGVAISEVTGVDPTDFARCLTVYIDNGDGTRTPTFISPPHGITEGVRVPAIIHMHGGPEANEGKQFHPLMQYVINHCGLAVFSLNIPGSDGYGIDHLRSGIGCHDKLIEYVVKAREYAASLSWIDSDNIFLEGESFGGYMAMLVATSEYAEMFKGYIPVCGPTSIVTWMEMELKDNTEDSLKGALKYRFGIEDPRLNPDVDQRLSPHSRLASVSKPMLAIHGSADLVVLISDFGLIQDGHPLIKKVRVEGAGHQFDTPEHALILLTAMTDFINEQLGRSTPATPDNVVAKSVKKWPTVKAATGLKMPTRQ